MRIRGLRDEEPQVNNEEFWAGNEEFWAGNEEFWTKQKTYTPAAALSDSRKTLTNVRIFFTIDKDL